MKELVQSYFDEAGWLHEAYTPTMEEYMSVAVGSATYFLITTTAFLLMGDIATKEVLEWASNKPKIITASSMVGRLMNDIVSHKVCTILSKLICNAIFWLICLYAFLSVRSLRETEVT